MLRIKSLFLSIKVEFVLCVVFVLYRLPLLGFDIVNTDAPRWKERIFHFSSALSNGNFAGTNVIYHPGVTLMWIGTIGLKFFNLLFLFFYKRPVDLGYSFDYLSLHFVQKLFLVLFLAFLLFICLILLKRMFNTVYTILFFCIFTFEPMVLAYTRVLHTDALITFLLFTTFLLVFYYVKNRNKIWFVLSIITSGLAFLTKSNSLFLLPFVGLLFFVHFFDTKNVKNMVLAISKKYFAWILGSIFIFFLLWPAMWVTPVSTLKDYYNGISEVGVTDGHPQKWLGNEVIDPGVTFYPGILFIRYTPWFYILTFSGILLFLYSIYKYRKIDKFYLTSLFFVFFYIVFMTLPSKKLGRYILPIIPFLSLFATYFLYNVWEFVKKGYKLTTKAPVYIVSLLFICLSIFSTYKFFPEYLFYYNPLVGGFNGGRNIENPKWPLGGYVLSKYINIIPNIENINVFIRKPFTYEHFLNTHTYDVSAVDNYSKSGDLFILESVDDFFFLSYRRFKLIDVIKIDTVDYFWVYEITSDKDIK
ncbi:hypothetical protein COV24_02000 [candidate division WWE3 bacterium CG10_big_fil_rev_8_21_14_0_10_32_10]|uniref:Glycosyltransferase RgtA/B/C/D-like domain-containing protein n=1 Tax=candidate division WWE3 bacterium CG10_big_fil_rev_8_21_14_0_10_32_10 TaxID=1975090 RepID=A0A2H0RCN0_UNCKA|nr:MAG: hypothetical protein COV24_02000 [candidate division WWE3 bacterium CG10_big_fil_rev_8_21_14_0_10_32_10]